ncbi:diguanylate cyclase [Cellulomonas sp. APG4]|uniref:diguanylate cyclase n=1 Tax=Cellulomonas sp. APG4 TaxID=1538656 RepID=UPI00137AE929|nr:diguanylate cyclase [Cellulomonas sp. APG4]
MGQPTLDTVAPPDDAVPRTDDDVVAPLATSADAPSTEAGLAELVDAVDRLVNAAPARALEAGVRALEVADAAGDVAARLRVRYFMGWSHHLLSQDHAALEAMEEAIELARATGDRAWEGRVLSGLGAVHSGFGDNATGIEYVEESLEVRREIGDQRGVAASLHNLGVTFQEMGLFPERAREVLHEAQAMFAGLDDHQGRCASLLHLAALDLSTHDELAGTDPPGAEAAAIMALSTARTAAELVGHPELADNHRLQADALLTLARALIAAGELAEAAEAIEAAAGPGEVVDSTQFRLEIAHTRGRLRRAQGDLAGAVVELERGLDLGEAMLRDYERVGLLAALVTVHEEQGDHVRALAAHRRLHEATLRQRDELAERRARTINARLDVERARVETEIERLRSEQLERANRELEHHASHDPLTGLVNRRGFDAALAELTHDPEGRLTCIVGDLDAFKAVNDTYSHLVGDEVLRRVARIVTATVRSTDLVARIGGEELAVLVPGGDTAAAAALAERVRAAIASYDWSTVAPDLAITISLGVATRTGGESPYELHARADELLYAAKHAGRNRAMCCSGT